jgi:predicted peptidase
VFWPYSAIVKKSLFLPIKILKMNKFKTLLSLIITLAFSQMLLAQPNDTQRQTGKKFKKTVKKEVGFNYLIYLPENYSKTEKFPLIMFLHGSGERGDSLALVKKNGLPKIAGEMNLPFIIVSPQCPAEKWWDAEALKYLLDDIFKKYNVDKSRVYLTGLSMGGTGTWEMGWKYPEYFAAIAPVCGSGNDLRVCLMKDLPVWAFHGAKDDVIPLHASQEMVDALKECDGNVKFTVYPEADHDSWTETYNNPELYKWFLDHKKK